MRPIYKGDAEHADMWPGVVLTTKEEQRTLNEAVEALSADERKQRAIRAMLRVERFDMEVAGDRSSQDAIDLAWRITGGDDDPSIFPNGRPLGKLQASMAVDALKTYYENDPSFAEARSLASDIEENLRESQTQ